MLEGHWSTTEEIMVPARRVGDAADYGDVASLPAYPDRIFELVDEERGQSALGRQHLHLVSHNVHAGEDVEREQASQRGGALGLNVFQAVVVHLLPGRALQDALGQQIAELLGGKRLDLGVCNLRARPEDGGFLYKRRHTANGDESSGCLSVWVNLRRCLNKWSQNSLMAGRSSQRGG